jgi:hypothetical protein
MKNQNLLLTGILTIAISCPAFATGIGASDTTADCDNSTLGTYEGESTLQAQWTANRIYLNWYDDSAANNGSAINVTGTNAASCEYDGGITLPSNPSKTGYNFAGWRVRTASSTPILATLDASIDANVSFGHGWYNDADDYSRCTSETCEWDTTPYSGATDIALNEWKTEFSYGTIYGEASCNNTNNPAAAYITDNLNAVLSGDMTGEAFISGLSQVATQEETALVANALQQYSAGTMTYDEAGAAISSIYMTDANYNKNSTGQYCWCKATDYKPTNGNKSSVGASRWVFYHALVDSANCADNCANACGNYVRDDAAFRSLVFHSAQ